MHAATFRVTLKHMREDMREEAKCLKAEAHLWGLIPGIVGCRQAYTKVGERPNTWL